MAKSRELDRALARAKDDLMPEIGGKRMAGEIGGMLRNVRAMIDEAKLGITGAVTELMTEVSELKHVEMAIREETASVREMKTSILGNAVAGESSGTSQ
jgi:hypothetical protein